MRPPTDADDGEAVRHQTQRQNPPDAFYQRIDDSEIMQNFLHASDENELTSVSSVEQHLPSYDLALITGNPVAELADTFFPTKNASRIANALHYASMRRPPRNFMPNSTLRDDEEHRENSRKRTLDFSAIHGDLNEIGNKRQHHEDCDGAKANLAMEYMSHGHFSARSIANLQKLDQDYLNEFSEYQPVSRIISSTLCDAGMLPKKETLTGDLLSFGTKDILLWKQKANSSTLRNIAASFLHDKESSLLVNPKAYSDSFECNEAYKKLRDATFSVRSQLALRTKSVTTPSDFISTLQRTKFSTLEQIGVVNGHRHEVVALAFNPTGTRFVTGSTDWSLKIWDAKTGWLLHTLRGHMGDVDHAVINEEGTMVASGSCDGTTRVWSLHDGFPIAILHCASRLPTAQEIAISQRDNYLNRINVVLWNRSPYPDCKFLAVASRDDGKLRLWPYKCLGNNATPSVPADFRDSAKNCIVINIGARRKDYPVCMSCDTAGLRFVVGCTDGIVRVYSIRRLIRDPNLGSESAITALENLYQYDPEACAHLSCETPLYGRFVTPISHDLRASITAPPRVPLELFAPRDDAPRSTTNSTSQSVVQANQEAESSENVILCIAQLPNCSELVDVQFATGGNRFLSLGADGNVTLWSYDLEQSKWTPVNLLEIDPPSFLAALCSSASGTSESRYQNAFLANCNSFAADKDSSQAEMRQTDKSKTMPASGCKHRFSAMCWLKDDHKIVCGTETGYVAVYDGKSGAFEFSAYAGGGDLPSGSSKEIIGTLEPNFGFKNIVVSATLERPHVSLWDVEARCRLWSVTFKHGIVSECRFSDDGRMLIVSHCEPLDPNSVEEEWSQNIHAYGFGVPEWVAPKEQYFQSDFEELVPISGAGQLVDHQFMYYEEDPQPVRSRNAGIYEMQPDPYSRTRNVVRCSSYEGALKKIETLIGAHKLAKVVNSDCLGTSSHQLLDITQMRTHVRMLTQGLLKNSKLQSTSGVPTTECIDHIPKLNSTGGPGMEILRQMILTAVENQTTYEILQRALNGGSQHRAENGQKTSDSAMAASSSSEIPSRSLQASATTVLLGAHNLDDTDTSTADPPTPVRQYSLRSRTSTLGSSNGANNEQDIGISRPSTRSQSRSTQERYSAESQEHSASTGLRRSTRQASRVATLAVAAIAADPFERIISANEERGRSSRRRTRSNATVEIDQLDARQQPNTPIRNSSMRQGILRGRRVPSLGQGSQRGRRRLRTTQYFGANQASNVQLSPDQSDVTARQDDESAANGATDERNISREVISDLPTESINRRMPPVSLAESFILTRGRNVIESDDESANSENEKSEQNSSLLAPIEQNSQLFSEAQTSSSKAGAQGLLFREVRNGNARQKETESKTGGSGAATVGTAGYEVSFPEFIFETRQAYDGSYSPQIGDRVVYIREGHQEFLKSMKELGDDRFANESPIDSYVCPGGILRATVAKVVVKLSDMEADPPQNCRIELDLLIGSNNNTRNRRVEDACRLTYCEFNGFVDFLVLEKVYDASMQRLATFRRGGCVTVCCRDEKTPAVLVRHNRTCLTGWGSCFVKYLDGKDVYNVKPWELSELRNDKNLETKPVLPCSILTDVMRHLSLLERESAPQKQEQQQDNMQSHLRSVVLHDAKISCGRIGSATHVLDRLQNEYYRHPLELGADLDAVCEKCARGTVNFQLRLISTNIQSEHVLPRYKILSYEEDAANTSGAVGINALPVRRSLRQQMACVEWPRSGVRSPIRLRPRFQGQRNTPSASHALQENNALPSLQKKQNRSNLQASKKKRRVHNSSDGDKNDAGEGKTQAWCSISVTPSTPDTRSASSLSAVAVSSAAPVALRDKENNNFSSNTVPQSSGLVAPSNTAVRQFPPHTLLSASSSASVSAEENVASVSGYSGTQLLAPEKQIFSSVSELQPKHSDVFSTDASHSSALCDLCIAPRMRGPMTLVRGDNIPSAKPTPRSAPGVLSVYDSSSPVLQADGALNQSFSSIGSTDGSRVAFGSHGDYSLRKAAFGEQTNAASSDARAGQKQKPQEGTQSAVAKLEDQQLNRSGITKQERSAFNSHQEPRYSDS